VKASPTGHLTRRAASLAAILQLVLPPTGTAQNPPRAGVRESVVVRAAEIEVLVLDAEGRPVTDLTRDEFILRVNGSPQKIDWVLPPGPPANRQEAVSTEIRELPGQEAQAPESPPVLSHSTVVFIDDLHMNFRSRSMGLNALRVHLDTLPAGEEIALYGFRHHLEILQRFTTDRTALKSALDRLGRTTPVSQLLHSQAEWAGQSEAALQAFSQMLQALAGRPEPKTLIVLAEYLPTSSWELDNPMGTASTFDFAASIRQDSHDAFLARATILALDPSGIHPFGPGLDQAAPVVASAPSTTGAATPSVTIPSLDSFQAPAANHLETGGDVFAVLARETGGARISNTNRLAQDLGKQADLLNARYRIGFTPDAGSSEIRSVAVRVTRPGLSVRTATGQGSLVGEGLTRARFASAVLTRDLPPADFPIKVEPVKSPRGWMTKTLSFEIRIPARELFVQDRGDSLTGNVEVLVASEDDRGGVGDVQRQAVEVRLSKKDVAKLEHAFFRLPLTLQIEGKGFLLVGVRDTTTNRLGEARVAYPR
jgi:VWFA-related protein